MGSIEPAASTAASLLARGSLAGGGGKQSVPGLAALVDGTFPRHPDLRDALERPAPSPRTPPGSARSLRR